MDQTTYLNLPIPNAAAEPPTNISDEFPRIALALIMLDLIVYTLQGVVAGKAEADHTQAISTITGLTEALAGKMSASATFSLDSLTDVQGAADAVVNYVLVKKSTGQWEPSSALAALGLHNHAITEVVGLTEQLVSILDSLNTLSLNKANKSVTIGVGGLATGGGDLSGNRTITVPKASEAQAQARSQDDVALTPLTGDKMAVARDARFVHVRDQKAAGTSGGASSVGLNIRALNTTVLNNIAGASLASNQVTLPAGTYDFDATAPAFQAANHQLAIRLSSGTVLLTGPLERAANANAQMSTARVRGRLTFATSVVLELVHYFAVADSNGLGSSTNTLANAPVYADLFIKRVD